MRIAGYEINEADLQKFVEDELEAHRYVFSMVKDYIDDIIHKSFGYNPEELKQIDPPTYIAIVLELTRTIYINVVNYLKYQSYKKKYQEGYGKWKSIQR